MEFQAPQARSVPGTLHFIPPNLSAFEIATPLVRNASTNTILWVGGLCDTYLSVTYPSTIAEALGPSWSMTVAALSSSGLQFGVSSVAKDAEDMAKIIAYLKAERPEGKIVIMGHSTGCQDCLHYLTGPGADGRPKVDGIILQAPVSDREALEMVLPEAHMVEANRTALEWCRTGRSGDVLANRLTRPIFGKAAITARRWVDLASPPPDRSGAEDFFSSDLADDRLKTTFGRSPRGVLWLFLYSGADESVPATVDKERLVQKWTGIVKQAGGVVDEVHGGVVPDASHNLNGSTAEVSQDLVRRVLGFIEVM